MMDATTVCVTGGAGFVGASLAQRIVRDFAGCRVIAFDNLSRRGSELNLPRLAEAGVPCVRGDVRNFEDLDALPDFDVLIDCAAEPAVAAGTGGDPTPVLRTNIVGTMHCLEAARRRDAAMMFLSTSRVYPIRLLNDLAFNEGETRFTWRADQELTGWSSAGVGEDVPLAGARSLYGTAKLAGEHLAAEYLFNYGMPTITNRCGVIAGPWQMGKVDQGFVCHWVLRHALQQPLDYIGFGGQGKQARDVLHIDDLCDLVVQQLADRSTWQAQTYCVGGGVECSTSLLELTEICRRITGNSIEIGSRPETSPLDIRIIIMDSAKIAAEYGWRPKRSIEQVVEDTYRWLIENQSALAGVL
jgi:CDP-paratose 2-epimerase